MQFKNEISKSSVSIKNAKNWSFHVDLSLSSAFAFLNHLKHLGEVSTAWQNVLIHSDLCFAIQRIKSVKTFHRVLLSAGLESPFRLRNRTLPGHMLYFPAFHHPFDQLWLEHIRVSDPLLSRQMEKRRFYNKFSCSLCLKSTGFASNTICQWKLNGGGEWFLLLL